MIQGWADDRAHNQSVQTIWYESEGSHFQCYSLQTRSRASIICSATPTARWTNCDDEGVKCPKDIPAKSTNVLGVHRLVYDSE